MFKTFAIIISCFSALSLAQSTFAVNTTGLTTTTLATILAQNFSHPTPFVPTNVSPITFQHTDAVTTHHPHLHAIHHTPNDAILFGNEVKSLSELPLETLLKIKRHLEEMTNGMTQAENVMYPVYEDPPTSLSPGFLNLGGGTFVGSVHHDSPEDVGFVTQNRHANQFTENGDLVKFYDHGKQDNYQQHHGEQGLGGYITPQPFIHKFKKKHASEMWESEKPSKIQTIFQVSVTALSFLAFGGYLLCMILAALKAKGTAVYPSAAALTHIHNRPNPNVPVKLQTNKKRRPSYGRRRRRRSNNYDDDTLTRDNNQILPYNEEQMFHALISVAEGYVKFNDFYHK